MRNLIILISILTTNFTFGQDPSCEYFLTFKDVQSNLYDYEILVEDDAEKQAVENIKKQFEGNYSLEKLNCALFKSENGKELISGFRDDYCYPRSDIEEQLRIIVARKNKNTSEIEIMYATVPLGTRRTRIEIEKFVSGKREVEIYSFVDSLKDIQNSSDWFNTVLQSTRTIKFK
ncbi:hypothetical protein [Gelidibacter mesophilus]|uniref:hypothetical protein n=1 Tax=Gelidibacter mesophilus TaxID=169050 RepID=UPI00040367B7|nr:hypothetical protein [Gelidibacter mesophilus]